jgi:Arc/MetJ-type ribon-helix-helix transcriptional regulator
MGARIDESYNSTIQVSLVLTGLSSTQAIDELVRRRLYPNRAEAIRMALRDFIRSEVQISE